MIVRFFLTYLIWLLLFINLQIASKRKSDTAEVVLFLALGVVIGVIAAMEVEAIIKTVITLVLLYFCAVKKMKIPWLPSGFITLFLAVIVTVSTRFSAHMIMEYFPGDLHGMFLYFPMVGGITTIAMVIVLGIYNLLPRGMQRSKILQTLALCINGGVLWWLGEPSLYNFIYEDDCFWEIATEPLLLQLFLFFIGIYICLTMVGSYRRIKEVKELEREKERGYRAIAYYTEEIEKQYTEMRKFRHDYQNILNSMDSYISEEDYDGLREYFATKVKKSALELTDEHFRLENLGHIKIREIKSILATKLMAAVDIGIDVEFEAREDIDSIPMESLTLVRMIGILLDNAIEELEELKRGKLLVGFVKLEEDIMFVVQNTCRLDIPKVHQLKQLGFSTKGSGRGIGLTNLSELANEQDNVSLETVVMGDQFIQKVVIGGRK